MIPNYQAHQIGEELVKLFGLKETRDGKYETNMGPKSAIGVARCVEKVLKDIHAETLKFLEDE